MPACAGIDWKNRRPRERAAATHITDSKLRTDDAARARAPPPPIMTAYRDIACTSCRCRTGTGRCGRL
ncbi:hypothetical protein F7R21_31895 [Burkholderia latens]|uniref:Uncharacterized protein n=1 Tax=Burkholderia latens TaxID=488446 RepID=A0A6H9SI66_9BURK|nr:hypothetical protein F7R21_31895 [Burkholderia latens]